MKLPVQAAAVVRDTIRSAFHASPLGAVVPQVRLGDGPACPPNSRTNCADGQYCCQDANGAYYCSDTSC
jgi:hypothetical protein